ncbi:hypothetical protein SELMODRAFT_427472 [Selaginella moellendorffii]|uniref:Uncharacterized protein n=1 Tax=Selaginella moellendorffii TaxID=88036 RepID=D8SZQ9_SELML|nr:hypothetical protein SELMODRAFT_427472 [Selaginella moellendorffii]
MRMNDELRTAVGTSDCWDWYAQNMSLVVRRTCVCVTCDGVAVPKWEGREAEPSKFSFPSQKCRKERLTTADSYVSNHLVCHMDSHYTSVFTTRIDALYMASRKLAARLPEQGLMNAGHSELLRQKVANGVTREEYTRHLLPDRDPCIRMMDLKEKDLKVRYTEAKQRDVWHLTLAFVFQRYVALYKECQHLKSLLLTLQRRSQKLLSILVSLTGTLYHLLAMRALNT